METSKAEVMTFPDVSCTADVSTCSCGVVRAITVARLPAFSVNDIVTLSDEVSSSPADSVIPPDVVPDSLI